ncbi:MAG: PAS domain S-box protein [Ferruginibacter sp.]
MESEDKIIPAFLTGGGQMGTLIRSFDWSKIALGRPDTWPQSLRIAVRIMLDCPFGMYIAWGNEYIQLYNDGYRPILGATKHPQALGISTRETFAEIWPTIGPMFEGVMQGTPVGFPDFILQLDRNGFLEECVFDFSYSPIRLEDGEVGGVLVTVIETTEKVHALKALQEREQELQFAIEATGLGTWDLNLASNKVRGNSRLKDWFGLKPDEEIVLPLVLEVIADRDRDKVTAAIQKALQFDSGGHYNTIYTIIHPHTKIERTVHAKGQASFNDEGIACQFNGTLQDITEEVVARRLLTDREQHLSNERMVLYNSFMNAPAGIAILKGDTQIYEFANAEYEKLVDRKITIGKTVQALFPEAAQQGLIEILNNVFLTGEPFVANEFPIELINKRTGKLVLGYYNLVIQPIRDENGYSERLLSHVVEVTQQVEARKQIEEANRTLGIAAILTENIADAVIGTDMDNKIISWNKGAEKLYGYTRDEVMGQPGGQVLRTQFLSDEDKQAWPKFLAASGRWQGEVQQLKKDGTQVNVLVSIAYVYDRNGNPVAGVGVNRDITERKKAAEEIIASETKFRTLSENIPHMVWTATPDGKKDFFNKYFLEYTGLSFDKLNGDGWHAIIFPDDLTKELELWNSSLETGEDYKIEKRIRQHDGTYRWHLCHCIAQKDKAGRIIGWIGTNTEIDEQIKITEALAKGEEQFRTFANSIQNLAWIANGDGWVYWYNQQWLEYTGLTLEETQGWGWQKAHHPDHVEKITALSKELWKKDEAFELHFPLRRFDGEYRWFLTRAYPVKDANGIIERWIGTNTDIDDQKNFTDELESKVKERTYQLHIQNETFKQAEESSMQGSYSFNLTSGNLSYSDNLYRIIGYEPNEFKPSLEEFNKHVHPEDRDYVTRAAEQVLESKTADTWYYRIITKRGQIINIKGTGRVIESGDEKLLVGTLQDVTKEFELNKELQEKEAYRKQIINNAPDAVIVINEKSIITLWNPKTEEIFGWKAEEVLGLSLTDIIVPTQYRQAHRDGMERFLTTGEAHILNKSLELTALNKAGIEFPISLTISQATQQGNKLFIAFLRDITLEKRRIELTISNQSLLKANAALEASQKLSEKLLKQRDEFISIASHEMKTPLTSAKGYTELLMLSLREESQPVLYAAKANQAVDRLHDLVTELLDASKIQNGQLNFNITTFDLNSLVDETIENTQHSAKTHSIQKTSDFSQLVTGDRNRLQQVVINLLTNAVKYSPNADKVLVKIEKQEGKIQVSVQDFGIGMSGKHLNKIFDRYYRVDEHAIHFQGLGIGLYISHNIIERHNGKLWAESEPEKGSTFYFTLPL